MLGITELYQGVSNKSALIEKLFIRYGISQEQSAAIGDELNDLGMFKAVGVTACPADACRDIAKISDFVMSKNGGEGAVREFIEMLKDAKNICES
jgi:3-deoxy-D-manno-octulosonate 8-phosphate phosphatase (KDO 8-P phosphatase)